MSDIPAGAERLSLMDWITTHREPSRLIPGVEKAEPYIVCPRCKNERPIPKVMRTVNCAHCGLFLHIDGDLHVWTDAEQVPT